MERLKFIIVCFHRGNLSKVGELAKEISVPCIFILIKETCAKSEPIIVIGVAILSFLPMKPVMGFAFKMD